MKMGYKKGPVKTEPFYRKRINTLHVFIPYY